MNGWMAIAVVLLALMVAKEFGYGISDLVETYKGKKNETIIERIFAHYNAPTAEIPTIATVVDPEQLKGQPFFEHAEKGDKVLVFRNAKRAVLYRPSIDRIIEIMPIDADQMTKGIAP